MSRKKKTTLEKLKPLKFSRTTGMLFEAFKDIPIISNDASHDFLTHKINPAKAEDFIEFAQKYNLSPKVLIQIKRHDKHKDLGRVYIRKNKDTNKMEIWRDPSQVSIY